MGGKVPMEADKVGHSHWVTGTFDPRAGGRGDRRTDGSH